MGLEGHIKYILDTNKVPRAYQINTTLSTPRLYVDTKYISKTEAKKLRNKIYDILGSEGEFNPKKVGKYVISFKKMDWAFRKPSYTMFGGA